MHVLLRTDNTRDHFSSDVRGTGQTAALRGHVIEQKTIIIFHPTSVVFRTAIQTHELTRVLRVMRRSQVARVLGRPALGTGKGGWHHDGDGLRGHAHGAGDVVVVVIDDVLILCAVDVTV